MGIDITKFHQTFFDESFEGLEIMESGLLDLEGGDSGDDDDAVNRIFRAAHSIKGGAGTLGFSAVADLTHLLETILDRRRAGTAPVTEEVIDSLLESVDCLREMLSAARDETELDVDRVASVSGRLQTLVGADAGADAGGTGDAVTQAMVEGEPLADPPQDTAAPGGWRVSFAPHADLFRTGNDPVRILGELADLGRYRVTADLSSLPPIENLDVEVCYASWTVDVLNEEGRPGIDRAAVDRVFEWVESDADIDVVALDADGSPLGATVDPDTGGGRPATDHLAGDAPAEAPAAPNPGPTGGGEEAERRSGEERRRSGGQDRAAATTTSIRVDIEKVDALINLVGELVITQSMLQQLALGHDQVDLERLQEGLSELEGHTRELQGSVMQIRMLPISYAFNRLAVSP